MTRLDAKHVFDCDLFAGAGVAVCRRYMSLSNNIEGFPSHNR
jgi:hypothetical protein